MIFVDFSSNHESPLFKSAQISWNRSIFKSFFYLWKIDSPVRKYYPIQTHEMEMIQSVKNDSVHLNQIENIRDDFEIWLNASSELNDEMPILNGYNIVDRLFKSVQEKRLILINICMIPIHWQ